MTLEEAIDESITQILELNPDLTYAEVYELCSDYLLKFNKPTKEENFCKVPITYTRTLGYIANLIKSFKKNE